MSKPRFLTAQEAADALNVSLSTIYSYVSRGLIRSEPVNDGSRQKRYHAEDITTLIKRKEANHNPEVISADALRYGNPVLDSAISLIEGDELYYRAHNIAQLVAEQSIEAVASLIWTGGFGDQDWIFSSDNYLDLDAPRIATGDYAHLQTTLALAAEQDIAAYDCRPHMVAKSGGRILRVLVNALSAGHDSSIADALSRAWGYDDPAVTQLLNTALIICADHELNASSFTARITASTGATPYMVTMAGFASLTGVKHGAATRRVTALLNEIDAAPNVHHAISSRLQRGEKIYGLGHPIYQTHDPRFGVLWKSMMHAFPNHPDLHHAQQIIDISQQLTGEFPNIDFSLAILCRLLTLKPDSPLVIFAIGRTVGWIGHAIEQYESDQLIRPRARYVGNMPISD